MFFDIDDLTSLKAAISEMCAVFREEEVPEGAVFDCKLVARELLSNALSYGGGSAKLKIQRAGSEIYISVKSARSFEPPKVSTCSSVNAERGRGLYLVDALSASRAYSDEDGICVIVKIEE